MSRDSYASLAAEICATEFARDEQRTDRELEAAHKRLHRPTYDDLLRQVIALTEERDTWRDGYMDLAKLLNVPEC